MSAGLPAPDGGEFVRIVDVRLLPAGVQDVTANATECRRLAGRFGLTAITRLVATVTFANTGDAITVTGRLRAEVIQACAISAEDFDVVIDEPVNLRFATPGDSTPADTEIELTADDCDEIAFDGLSFDLGEALAQTLALAIDPFAEGPEADRARAEHKLAGAAGNGAFAALGALKIGE